MSYRSYSMSFRHLGCRDCDDDEEYRMHSRDEYGCDICGRYTHHWRRIGDICACRECYSNYKSVGLEQAFTIGNENPSPERIEARRCYQQGVADGTIVPYER